MLLVTDKIGLTIGFKNGIFDGDTDDRISTIMQKELGYSVAILKEGYNINCILSEYSNRDYRNRDNHSLNSNNNHRGDPWFTDSYFNKTINPYEAIFIKTNNGIRYHKIISIGEKGRGMCNQLFALINGIIQAEKSGTPLVVINDFYPDYSCNDTIDIAEIIDLQITSHNIKSVNIFSLSDVQLNRCIYSTNSQTVDIPLSRLPTLKTQKINILKPNFDPYKSEQIILEYIIGGINYSKSVEWNSHLTRDISGDSKYLFSDVPIRMGWYHTYGINRFNDILSKLRFDSRFYNIALDISSNYRSNDVKLNVIHLRVEKDAIKHWAKMNKMTEKDFASIIHQKYITLIQNHIPPGEDILILSSSYNNPVLDYMQNKYNVLCFDAKPYIQKYFPDIKADAKCREMCAIVDLILGQECDGVFIGCHNLRLKRGSSFSYVLYHMMKNNERNILIDLDNIKANAQIINKN